jgi:hypothetical protein
MDLMDSSKVERPTLRFDVLFSVLSTQEVYNVRRTVILLEIWSTMDTDVWTRFGTVQRNEL